MMEEELVGLFPGIANASGFTIGDGDGVDRIRVLMIQNKEIVVSATGRDMETTCLIRVRLEKSLMIKKRDRHTV